MYFDSAERVAQGSYTTLSSRAGWTPAGSQFRFEVLGKNLNDGDCLISVYEDAAPDGAG